VNLKQHLILSRGNGKAERSKNLADLLEEIDIPKRSGCFLPGYGPKNVDEQSPPLLSEFAVFHFQAAYNSHSSPRHPLSP